MKSLAGALPQPDPHSDLPTSTRELSDMIERLYRHQSPFLRNLQRWRPYAAPFLSVFEAVPKGASVLDIGCGGGLVLNTLAQASHIRSGKGIDVAAHSVRGAQAVAELNGLGDKLSFEARDITSFSPDEQWECVTVIDVIHHVPVAHQEGFVRAAYARVAPGGRLIVRDPVRRPLWRNLANMAHDLVLAREIVHSRDPEMVAGWLSGTDLKQVGGARENRLWYGYWMLVFDRPAA